jgi:hypothetical protein
VPVETVSVDNNLRLVASEPFLLDLALSAAVSVTR